MKRVGSIMKSAISFLLQLLVYGVGAFLVFWICKKIGIYLSGYGPNFGDLTIEKITRWAQILTAYAALYALGEYFRRYTERENTETRNALEMVGFFRKVVLIASRDVRKSTREKKVFIPMLPISKNSATLVFSEKTFFKKIWNHQKTLIEEYSKIVSRDPELEDTILYALNALEEFSIAVINTKSEKHEALSSIQKPYIEMVENLAVPLYSRIGEMGDGFEYTSKLYSIWKNKIKFVPRTASDRKEKFKEKFDFYNKK